jgi:hypothetical protein
MVVNKQLDFLILAELWFIASIVEQINCTQSILTIIKDSSYPAGASLISACTSG